MTQDVRFALRAFRFNPVFSATAVVAFALGMAATTTPTAAPASASS